MAANRQTERHTHARAQCSHTSVGLTQACPNYNALLSTKVLNNLEKFHGCREELVME